MRKIAAVLLLSLAIASGCSSMSASQKAQTRADVMLGLEILAAGVAGMPGTDPTVQYWSKYAAGVLKDKNTANPTAAPSPADQ